MYNIYMGSKGHRHAATPLICLMLLGLFLASCHHSEYGQFSLLPGFQEYYKSYSPADHPPTEEERALLEAHRPRFFLSEDAEPFIDFYHDYIAHGYLTDSVGNMVSRSVTSELLNEYSDQPGAVFVHEAPESSRTQQVAYGRVDYDTLVLPGGREARLTFLTYNIVFRTSGLPEDIAWWQSLALRAVASLEDLHQLDHYISATIALTPMGKPIAVTLQQHNYQTTYIIGRGIELPGDGRLMFDVAMRSNELYPHSPGRTRHRCAAFLTPETARWLIKGEGRTTLAGYDVTEGSVEVEYKMRYLPQTDAFYTFLGMLGEPRTIEYRNGPPGAEFNTIPALKPRATALVTFYRRGEGDDEYIELLRQWDGHYEAFITPHKLSRYTQRFMDDLSGGIH